MDTDGGWVQGRMATNGGTVIGREIVVSGGVAEDMSWLQVGECV